MTDLPEPLVPADRNLSDFPRMPIDIPRLRRSKAWLIAKKKPELGFYMFNLWCAAWHETPPGSLEDDEEVLADRAICKSERWPVVREQVMRNWVKCSDGRLYHETVAEMVEFAWAAKMAQRERTRAATEAKAKKHREALERQEREREAAERAASEGRDGNRNDQRDDDRDDDRDDHQGKGRGKGKVKGEGLEEKEGAGAPGPEGPVVSDRPMTAKDLIALGVNAKHARDWLKVRKEKKAPLTETAWDGVVREAALAGLTPPEAVSISAENSWRGFRASWLTHEGVRGLPVKPSIETPVAAGKRQIAAQFGTGRAAASAPAAAAARAEVPFAEEVADVPRIG